MAEKRNRSNAKGRFTRQETHLTGLLDIEADKVVATPAYEKFVDCWNRLEESHDAFIAAVDIDVENDVDGDKYLDTLNVRYGALVQRYAEYLKTSNEKDRADRRIEDQDARTVQEAARKRDEESRKAADAELFKQEQDRKFVSMKAELDAGIVAFKGLAVGLEETVLSCCDSVKLQELKKVEIEFDSLKSQLIKLAGVDNSKDIADVHELFLKDAESVYIKFRNSVVKDIKNTLPLRTSGGDSSIKKEPVKLPHFSGDEKGSPSPFLTFPIWLKQWKSTIVLFKEDFRDQFLCDKLDATARRKIIGFENNYPEAMKRLEQYYGDATKVIKCVVKEVQHPNSISENDYQGLVDYSTILEHNYNRLLSMNLEHEMSNHSIMSQILKKFPCSIEERWLDHLLDKSDMEKAKPFPVFVKWLAREKEKWSHMITPEIESEEVFHGHRTPEEKQCFGCGGLGHIRRFCPKEKNHDPSGGGGGSGYRRPLSVKKFHCALHKGDKSRKCESRNCSDLRKMSDVQKRVNLLKENKDCVHCCGDHESKDCSKKDRVCGGGRPDRGCTKGHKIHELFCTEAQVCMMVGHTKTLSTKRKKDGVVLYIMRVRVPLGLWASVLFDTGSTLNFIRDTFARSLGFKGKSETLSITTLGGKVTEYFQVINYSCKLLDEKGIEFPFHAYGLESITSRVAQVPLAKLKRLFPNTSLSMLKLLHREAVVDVLIGVAHLSWHPKLETQAVGGGDLWIASSNFGICVGGSHPMISDGTKKSDEIFSVNQTYFTTVSVSTSHELEYCPARVSRGLNSKSAAV